MIKNFHNQEEEFDPIKDAGMKKPPEGEEDSEDDLGLDE